MAQCQLDYYKILLEYERMMLLIQENATITRAEVHESLPAERGRKFGQNQLLV